MNPVEAARAESTRARRAPQPRQPFSAALRDAATARPCARGGPPSPTVAGPGRLRRVAGAAGEAERSRQEQAPPQPPEQARSGPARPVTAEGMLRAAVRAVPAAALALRAQGGGALRLDLGRALSVELRAVPSGVEVVLRPDAALSRAAAAGLPGLVSALRARGVAVARAEVRAAHRG